MYVPCVDCRLRQRPCFRPFSDEELKSISSLKTNHVAIPAKTDIVSEGEVGGALYTLYEGWAFRYKTFGDGARQILDLLLPGEIIGLSSALLGTIRHSVQTLTPVSLCVLDGYPMPTLLRRHVDLTLDLLRWRVEEEHRADTRLALLGRQTPLQRVGHLMLETFDRLRRLELANGTMCPFPLQRQHLADAAADAAARRAAGGGRGQDADHLRPAAARRSVGLQLAPAHPAARASVSSAGASARCIRSGSVQAEVMRPAKSSQRCAR
jgi:CRP/FNR family transcriptional regulator, anaerobic regulatory protein